MASKPRKQRRTPKFRDQWQIISLRFAFAIGGRLSVKWATQKALAIWFSTHRSRISKRESLRLDKLERQHLSVADESVIYYRSGKGPNILLLHGWNGRAGQFLNMAEALVDAGFCVIMPDAPGHGSSTGNGSDIFKFVETAEKLQEKHGEFYAVLGHSFGSMALLYGLSQNIQANRLICVSAPAEFAILIDKFAEGLWLPDNVVKRMKEYLEQRFGKATLQAMEPVLNASRYQGKALIIHDEDDGIVPIAAQASLLAAFPNGQKYVSQHQGHNRVLRNAAVIKRMVEFLAVQAD